MRRRILAIIGLSLVVVSLYALLFIDFKNVNWPVEDPDGPLTAQEVEFVRRQPTVFDQFVTEKESDRAEPSQTKEAGDDEKPRRRTLLDKIADEESRGTDEQPWKNDPLVDLEKDKLVMQARRERAESSRERFVFFARLITFAMLAAGLGMVGYSAYSSAAATSLTRRPKLLVTAGAMFTVLGCGLMFSKRFAFPWSEDYFSESEKAFYGTAMLVIGAGLLTPGILSLVERRSVSRK